MRHTGRGTRARAGMVVMAAVLLGVAGCGDGGTESRDTGNATGGPGRASRAPGKAADDPGRALDAAALGRALPTPRNLPPGWRVGVTPPKTEDLPPGRRCPKGTVRGDCSPHGSYAVARYKAPGDSGTVYWELFAYPDRETVETAFAHRKVKPEKATDVAMPRVGDDSTAYRRPAERFAPPSLDVQLRVGNAVAHVMYVDPDKNPDSARTLLALSRAQADRLLKAQRNPAPETAAD
ncbi:hypothetical protein ACSNOK_11035 [Streptomyces sp. URMC 126]|uniref:hypothetical protein n=1 Tax=Streptomyces sp. URMC 126 TaxID=3423401 RepID=UPI003F1B1EED